MLDEDADVEATDGNPDEEELSEKDIFLNALESVKDDVHVHIKNVDTASYSDSSPDDVENDEPYIIDVFDTLSSTHRVEGTVFNGICIDTGAQRSVVGTKHAQA